MGRRSVVGLNVAKFGCRALWKKFGGLGRWAHVLGFEGWWFGISGLTVSSRPEGLGVRLLTPRQVLEHT